MEDGELKSKKEKEKSINFIKVMKKPDNFEKKIRFVVISDTHQKHNRLLNGLRNFKADYLIVCGDFTNWYEWKFNPLRLFSRIPRSVNKFNDFLGKIKGIQNKIVIAGNHDQQARSDLVRKEHKWKNEQVMKEKMQKVLSNAIFMSNDELIIENKIKLYAPAFNVKRLTEKENRKKWKSIPDDTNILVTHFPSDFGDDYSLLDRIQEMKSLKVHCFGHFHDEHSVEVWKGITFINAASFNGKEEKNKPICFDYYL